MISFKPLFKTLIDREITKEQLRLEINASSSTMAKMGKIKVNEKTGKYDYVAMRIVDDICNHLNCNIEDVIEFIPDEKETN